MSEPENWEMELENWEPEPVKPPIESMLSKASPFREDKRSLERKEKAVPATSRRFECPGCGLPWHVQPTFSGEEWHYFGLCGHCGASWVNAYHLMIRCEECGKKNPITSKNPDGKCKCAGETPRPF